MDSPTNWLTACCDTHPVGAIEFDAVDGPDGSMIQVSYATCLECRKFSSVTLTGTAKNCNELR